MRIVVQRVSSAAVRVEGAVIGKIGQGLLVLVGIGQADTRQVVDGMAEKLVHLRLFERDGDRMNASVLDMGGSILSVSQFTLYGDVRKGRRPSFSNAAAPEDAVTLYEDFNTALRARGVGVETGQFGAHMEVELVNDGPVTLLLDSEKTF